MLNVSFLVLVTRLPVDDLVEQVLPIPELLMLDLCPSLKQSSLKLDDFESFLNRVSISLVYKLIKNGL
jgi:hypothetical protein